MAQWLIRALCLPGFSGIYPNQNRLCYVGTVCKVENLRVQHLEGDTKIKLLNKSCGSKDGEWDALPNSGIMTKESATDEHLTVGLPEVLPSRRECP